MKSKIERFDEIWNRHSTSFQEILKPHRSLLIAFFDYGYDYRKDEEKENEVHNEKI